MIDPIVVSVGELTDLCRRGDINFRFTARSSALEGIRGHQFVQKSRGKDYVSELAVSIDTLCEGLEVRVQGRVDGVAHVGMATIVDEIKTLRIPPAQIPQSVADGHWHQAMLYAYLLASESGLDRVTVRLCYFHLDEMKEYQQSRLIDFTELSQCFVETLLRFTERLLAQRAWEATRINSLALLGFPHAAYRAGQRDLAVSVYRSIQANEQLIIQAPTGLGKTIGTIFPAIKGLAPGLRNRVFYLSAKTSTQVLAEQAVLSIAAKGARIRSITISAKSKVCFNPAQPCHPDHCEYAKGYYDRVDGAVASLLEQSDHHNRTSIELIARQHTVCPFELGLDLSRHSDLIISDYNYVFDPVVYLRRFFDANSKDSIALIDEAHNLVDRGREMFSATVVKESYLDISRLAKPVATEIHKAALAVNRAILTLRNDDREEFQAQGFCQTTKLPQKVLLALQRFCSAAEEELKTERQHAWQESLLDCYFSSLRFVRTAENYQSDYVTLLQKCSNTTALSLYCVDPSRQLGYGFDRLASAVCFSATMNPQPYFQRLLGTSSQANWYRLASPFSTKNLQVSLATYIDTSFKRREASSNQLVELIHTTLSAKEGNYLIFFPSYAYLEMIFEKFRRRDPDRLVVRQLRDMTDADRDEFIKAFDDSLRPICGFAVMGGAFSEGIDLKGEALIGAVVVGVGLPQIGIERDLIKQHFPDHGFEYAYQYPGIIKVLQTAGRVIRDEADRGIVCLVDSRYLEHRYASLLPAEWLPTNTRSLDEYGDGLNVFWHASLN